MSTAIAATPVTPAITPEIRRVSAILRLASETVRIGILEALRDKPLETSRLRKVVGVGPITLAYHSRLLRLAGAIDAERIGFRSIYSLTTLGRRLLAALDRLRRD